MTTTPITYSQALEALERVVRELEDGALPLEQLPEKINEANALLALCNENLRTISSAVQNAITGNPATE
ncbi:MAG TPA: exodeoxyribonuclease VII small subunit [Chitinophagaceae bacterium]|jgi:exodeoxyribonuclease VII small subunit|nr:exodeoxyribonuclease VII small subunit [Chitinophagaceae bacterium]